MRLLKSKPAHAVLIMLLIAVFLAELAFSIRYQSQTYDEGFHLVAGYRYWQCADFGINSEHPPLMKWIAAAPLWLGHAPAPVGGVCGKEETTKDHGYSLGVHYLFLQGLDGDSLLYRARLAEALFALILAVVCYLFARELFGRTAALVALFVLAFEPTILAHGALVTTDTAVTAFILASAYAFYRYADRPTFRRLLSTGVCAGLTFASKHSGVLIIPILLVLAVLELLRFRSNAWDPATGESTSGPLGRDLLRWAGRLVIVFAVAIAVLWGVYGFRFAARPNGEPMTRSLDQFIAVVQEQGTHGAMLTEVIPRLYRWHALPEAYLYGLVDVLNVSDPGQPPFLLGRLYPHGRWFYFPVVFFIKCTLGFLALLLIALVFGRWRDPGRFWKFFYLILPPIVILLVAMQSGLNIGYRHVLAMVPFLCIFIGGGVTEAAQRSRGWRVAIAALLLAHAASSAYAYPNYLPYSNEAFGGPMKTYRYLTDSNVDWGQGLYQLRDYIRHNGIRDCWLAYDGAAVPSYYGIPCKQLPANIGDAGTVPPPEAEGTFFIGDLTLSGIEWEPGALDPYRQFMQTRPVDNVGGAIPVYRGKFDLRDIAAVSRVAVGLSLVDEKPTEALSMAQAAIAQMPSSVRAHLLAGRALAALGLSDEARQQLQTALTLADQTGRGWYPLQIAEARSRLQRLNARPAK